MRLKLLPLLVVLPLGLSACGAVSDLIRCRSGYVRPNLQALTQDLAAARARWQAAGIQNYRYDLDQFAAPAGLPTLRVTVQGGQVVATVPVDPTYTGPVPVPGQTMEGLYGTLATSISSTGSEQCQFLTVSFDATDGHLISESGGTALKGIEDGFGSITLSNFTRL